MTKHISDYQDTQKIFDISDKIDPDTMPNKVGENNFSSLIDISGEAKKLPISSTEIKERKDEILDCLLELKKGLAGNELTENIIINLRNILEKNQTFTEFSILQDVVDDIILRSDAKINKKYV